MFTLIKSLLAPLLGVAGLMFGNGYFTTFVSVRLKDWGFSEQTVAFVQASYFLGLFISAFCVERLIIRIGHIRSFAFFACICASAILLQGIFTHPYAWMICRFATGFGSCGMYVVIESWFLCKSTAQTRGTILAFYTISLYGSQAFSQLLIDVIPFDGNTPYLVAALFCTISSTPVLLSYTRTPEVSEPSQLSLFKLFRASPFGFAGCFISGLILSGIYSLSPNYAQEGGLPVSIFMFLTLGGCFLLQWPIGRLSDYFDRRLVITLVCLCAIPPCLAITVLPTTNPTLIYILSFLIGGLVFTIYPLSISQVCDRLQPEDFTAATGALLITYGLGAVIGPNGGAAFMDHISSAALYLYFALLCAIIGGFGLFSLARRPRVPEDETVDFVNLPRMSPLAYELDPRADYEPQEEIEEDIEKEDILSTT